jgi:hypothetical protein
MWKLFTRLFGQKRTPRRRPIIVNADSIPSRKLIAICERYWKRLEQDRYEESAFTPEEQEPFEPYDNYQLAVKALGSRGPEVRDWARKLLSHPDYSARETGAWLLGELGERGELGDAAGAVIAELARAINRPFEEDPPKEATAIDLALATLGKIGDPRGISVIGDVLFSSKLEHEGDTQWEAACALENLVGEPFSESEDRVEAARSWLRTNPNR